MGSSPALSVRPAPPGWVCEAKRWRVGDSGLPVSVPGCSAPAAIITDLRSLCVEHGAAEVTDAIYTVLEQACIAKYGRSTAHQVDADVADEVQGVPV